MAAPQNKTETAFIDDLLGGEPTAPRRLVERYCLPLFMLLRKQFPFMPKEAVEDAAHDALLAVIAAPQNYEAARSTLLTYLSRIARNKVIDLLNAKKHTELEIFVGGIVALAQTEEKNSREGQIADAPTAWNESETLPPNIVALIHEILPAPIDRQIWDMVCDGRQETSDYAQLLGITHLPPNKQQAEVKRQRERVGKRVRRKQKEFALLLFGEEL